MAATFALGRPASAQENWDQIVAAAKKEGRVVFYNNLQPDGIEPILRKFREAYPEIQTEQIRLGSSPLNERFATEFSAGRHLTDVVITIADQRFYDGIKAGWAEKWSPPEAKHYGPEWIVDDTLFTVQQLREVIIWNKNLVKKEDEPKEWTDLFDPKWKGKVGFNPPWRSIPTQQLIVFWEDHLKLGDTAKMFKENEVRFFEGSAGAIQAVVRGDVAVAELTDLSVYGMLEDGAPIGFVYPESGFPLSVNRMFVAKNAPHPNAAKVLANWLLSLEGQTALQDYAGLPVTRGDVPPRKHLPATKDLKNVVIDGEKLLNPELQKNVINHWREVYGVK
jgi:iron(III) transport system substrate-binding protein